MKRQTDVDYGITKSYLTAENEADVKELDRICKAYDDTDNPTDYYQRVSRTYLITTNYTD